MLARLQYAGILAALVFVSGLSLAQPGQTNSAEAWQSMYDAGKFQEAIAALNKLLQQSPTNSVLHYNLGSCYDHLGYCLVKLKRHGEAVAAFKKALLLDPDDEYALLQMGACHYHLRAYREAVVPLEKYVAARPKDFAGFYYLGHSHFKLRQFEPAARALQTAHELKPDDRFTRLGLFLAYLAIAQYAQAYRVYPIIYTAGGGVLTLVYAIGLACMVVISFKKKAQAPPPVIASQPVPDCAVPPLLDDCQGIPPVLPGFIASDRLAAGDSHAPAVASIGDRANAWPGVWFSLAWMVLLFAGQIAWAFLLGLLPLFRGVPAILVGMGAAGLPLIVAAGAGFIRQPWGAPFRWPKPFPPVKLLALSGFGVAAVQLLEAGYSGLVEWISHKPFPVQAAVPFIQDALRTNPISVVISVVFLAPLAEEVLFRGLLFGALQKWFSALWTIILTAAIFAMIHLQVIYLLPIFLVGLLCGWARYKSGSLAVPVLLHMLNNGSSLLLMRFFPDAT